MFCSVVRLFKGTWCCCHFPCCYCSYLSSTAVVFLSFYARVTLNLSSPLSMGITTQQETTQRTAHLI